MRVNVEYDGFDPDVDRALERLTRVQCDGSGFGFGVRDLSWTFRRKSDADKFVARIKDARLGCRVSVREDR